MTTIDASIWLLIKEQADPETIHERFTSVYRPDEQIDFLWLYLYYATQADHVTLVLWILERRVDDVDGTSHVLTKEKMATCLNEAVRKGNRRLIDVFLDVDPALCSTVGSLYTVGNRFQLAYCPIGLAIHRDDADVLASLMRRYSGETIGAERQSPLHLAARCPAARCLRLLLANDRALAHINARDSEGWTPLLYAAMYHPDAVPELLRSGADASASVGKLGNVIQILSNWCTRLMIVSGEDLDDGDPCPTLAKRRTASNVSEEGVYIPDNFVSLATAAVEHGVDVDVGVGVDGTPLGNFAVNVHRRSNELRENAGVRETFVRSVAYLAEVSGQTTRDDALMKLCHAAKFVATQLRRCHDYGNMLGYMDLLPFIGRLMAVLLERGANADAREAVESGEKKIRAFQFLLPYANSRCAALKKLTSLEFSERRPSARFNSTVDVLLVAVLAMYQLRSCEPELYRRAVRATTDMIATLCESGAKCCQMLHLFTCLCVDPEITTPIFHRYLDCHSQEHYHDTLAAMQHYLSSLSSDEIVHFDGIRKEVAACQNRIYTLKQLVRRDLVDFLGGGQFVDKVKALPLPASLQSYLMS